jgi:hypothetical protein
MSKHKALASSFKAYRAGPLRDVLFLPPTLRREIWNSNDKELLVVP